MGERKIKVAFLHVSRIVVVSASLSYLCSIILWKHLFLSMPYAIASVAVSFFLLLVLFQLRFLPQMTVGVWSHLYGVVSPLFVGSLFSLPTLPLFPLLPLVFLLLISIGIWASYRFYPLTIDTRLHQARFARHDEMETLLYKNPCRDGLVLGRVRQFFFFHHFLCIRPTKTKKEIGNSLIIAPTGGGKGNQIESQILSWKESMIINDPKGDLFLKTAGDKAKRGTVYVIDPTRAVGHSYDPLHGKATEDRYLTVARSLVFDPKDRDPFFADSASLMIMQLFKTARIENIAPLVYLRHMIDLGLPSVAKRLHSIDPKLATAFLGANFADANLDNRTLTSVWSTLQTRLTPILTETLVRCFTRTDFTAETIMLSERPVTVYLRWEETELERLAPLVRVLCTSLVKELIACFDRVQGKSCRPVLLSLDEVARTPLPDLDGSVSTVRSRNIFFNLYVQSLSQLEKNYGEKEAQTISANMDTHEFLRPNDQDTARSIEELLGRGSKYAHSYHLREGNELSEGLSEQATPVMTARAIMEMPEKYALIFHRDFPPMKVLRLKWWQSKIVRKRHSLPVPVLEALPEIPPLPEVALGETATSGIRFVDPDEIVAKKKEKKAQDEYRNAGMLQAGNEKLWNTRRF
jgi:type IV secretion system protein VirD4